MNKELEALKEYRNQQLGVSVYADELLDTIEKALEDIDYLKSVNENQKNNIKMLIEENRTMKKALKALEIIKNKGKPYLICDKNKYFLLIDVGLIRLDKEEFDLLKEVLG